jgi:transcription initiation factor TFIIE subunit alpha
VATIREPMVIHDLSFFVDEKTLNKLAGSFGEEDAVKVINVLKGVDEITDDEIANKTGIRLNFVRKILYKLYDHSLVALRRSRDENTGWFIFHWKLQPDQLEGFILNQKKRVLEKLQTRLDYEKNHEFYFCGTPKCERVTFEDAVELVFKCPTCGKPMMHFDNGSLVEALEQKVAQLRKELGE